MSGTVLNFTDTYTHTHTHTHTPLYIYTHTYMGFPGGSVVKNLSASEGDMGLIPWLGKIPRERSLGERNDNPFHYYCLENPMDGGDWQATVQSH